ncbi:hypothetical protein A3F62_04615 [Candidatus Woesebacteria bacterium RIFCSPHIGHO2_12_FULL_44_11]|nr:MAG: hypothetical protein A3F62_04615 [Candidatus Woesebacteria bacterium RIFCSPHIGHO2_12_FULL_44_11]
MERMKTLGKIWLVIVFVPLFINLLLAISFKFQVLNYTFWHKALTDQAYQKLAVVFQEEIKKGEMATLSVIVTPENLQDLVDRNLQNLINFMNARNERLLVYLPVSKLPRGILPKNFTLQTEEMGLEELLNILPGAQATPLGYQYLRHTGLTATATLVISFGLLGLSFFGLYRLTEGGHKLTLPGITLIVSAVITGLIVAAKDLVMQGREPAQILLGTLAPPLLTQIARLWGAIAVATGILGIGLLFVTKPVMASKNGRTR